LINIDMGVDLPAKINTPFTFSSTNLITMAMYRNFTLKRGGGEAV
jgi:hypothetical protein